MFVSSTAGDVDSVQSALRGCSPGSDPRVMSRAQPDQAEASYESSWIAIEVFLLVVSSGVMVRPL